MKVLAFNGSPKKEGNTYHAIRYVADELQKEGIDVEIVHIGGKNFSGCTGCNSCIRNKDEKCVIDTDEVNELVQKMKEADGIILGSPVHFAGIGGNMKSFLDRAFYIAGRGLLRHKVGAAVVAVRRSGEVATFDQLNHYLTYAEMFMPTANYWSVIHGMMPGEVEGDKEGKQTMHILGKNMAYLMKLVEQGKSEVKAPDREDKIMTNFIR